jgi:hypothetical protein
MRFGGHESFAVREGWLSRGLELLTSTPELLTDDHSEDHLGVGRNMAKSIRHWLVASGLAEPNTAAGCPLQASKLGALVRKKDPHFLDSGTWWMLHVNLVGNPDDAFTWNWFFNNWSLQRFDRAPCIEGAKRFAAAKLPRTPSPRTIERDVATLLQSYARPIPARVDDPEDSSESPFQDLGLVLHHGASGYYQMNYDPKPITLQVFGYALSRMPKASDRSDITITEAERAESGPGRCFLLRGDEIYDLVVRYEKEDRKAFAMRSQAGERGIRFDGERTPLDWAKAHYAAAEVLQNA